MRILEAVAQRMRRELERGRGGDMIWPRPVLLEPPFIPFPRGGTRDLLHTATTEPAAPLVAPAQPPGGLVFLTVRLSQDDDHSLDTGERLVLALGSRYHVGLEVLGTAGSVSFQLAVPRQHATHVIHQLNAHYPHCEVSPAPDLLQEGASLQSARA